MSIQLKKLLLLLLYYSCVRKKNRQNGLTVLTYHKIADEPDIQDSLKVSKATFESQIIYLKKYYTILSGDQLANILMRGDAYPDNSCLITFDDGWLDNYTNAFQILKKHEVPAVIFISTDFIGTNNTFWHENLGEYLSKLDPETLKELKKGNPFPRDIQDELDIIVRIPQRSRGKQIAKVTGLFKSYSPDDIESYLIRIGSVFGIHDTEREPSVLSWEQIEVMTKQNIAFGSHTKSHRILTNVSIHDVERELSESKSIIETKTGRKVYFVAYPNGNYNQQILDKAKGLGYLAGFTCEAGENAYCDNPFTMKRKHIHEIMSQNIFGNYSDKYFKAELSGIRTSVKNIILSF